ncbi:MAG: basic amino acid ABC transporter substrate-binding protein [Oculatellaceae cyanobacterium Prado106]|jgi:arginine/lysine/histidine/glutamine transport system substrate-binding/permease protein|nr:basic amino acid ABC transporter substrate-binding protein [Oculatellaceae cyanobacterium Prado106]
MFRLTRSQFLRRLLPGLLGLICAFTFAACGTSTTSGSSGAAGGSNVLRVATEPAFPPFESQAADGTLEGFDIDLFKAIGEASGFTVEFQSLPFDGIIPALQAGTIDAAISAMTITKERAQTVSFSRPYFKAGLAIATKEATTDVTSLDSLKGKRIAVQIGTTGQKEAEKIEGAEIRTFDSAPLALQELSNGNVDAVINDAPVTLYAIKSGNIKGLKVVGQLLTEEFYGIAMPKDSPNLDKVNAGLTTILGNGKYAEIYQKWFGGQPPTLPETAPL